MPIFIFKYKNTFLICIINLVTDIAYGIADPRIMAQYTGGKRKKTKEASK